MPAIEFVLPPMSRASDLVAGLAAVAAEMAAGRLSPEEAQTVAAVLEIQRKAIETADLEQRLAVLEQRHGGATMSTRMGNRLDALERKAAQRAGGAEHVCIPHGATPLFIRFVGPAARSGEPDREPPGAAGAGDRSDLPGRADARVAGGRFPALLRDGPVGRP
jgi:hypothetical protein